MPLPPLQGQFLDEVLPRMQDDLRIVGVAAAGSIANGRPDVHSDVDLVLAIDDDQFEAVMRERIDLIASWTPLIAGFTGEHVGEPRVIIAIVGPPLLHVDFKFVKISDAATRVDELRVLWERDSRLTAALTEHPPIPPQLDLQWIEDRFWVWVHYGATKIARGELFEVIGFLAYLRETVLGPLISHRAGSLLQGVRKLETIDPTAATDLQATLSGYDRREAGEALLACVELYRRWRDNAGIALDRNHNAENLVMQFLQNALDQWQ